MRWWLGSDSENHTMYDYKMVVCYNMEVDSAMLKWMN